MSLNGSGGSGRAVLGQAASGRGALGGAGQAGSSGSGRLGHDWDVFVRWKPPHSPAAQSPLSAPRPLHLLLMPAPARPTRAWAASRLSILDEGTPPIRVLAQRHRASRSILVLRRDVGRPRLDPPQDPLGRTTADTAAAGAAALAATAAGVEAGVGASVGLAVCDVAAPAARSPVTCAFLSLLRSESIQGARRRSYRFSPPGGPRQSSLLVPVEALQRGLSPLFRQQLKSHRHLCPCCGRGAMCQISRGPELLRPLDWTFEEGASAPPRVARLLPAH